MTKIKSKISSDFVVVVSRSEDWEAKPRGDKPQLKPAALYFIPQSEANKYDFNRSLRLSI
jgi:hypothetical protein